MFRDSSESSSGKYPDILSDSSVCNPAMIYNLPKTMMIIERSLDVKLPTIWTVEKQR